MRNLVKLYGPRLAAVSAAFPVLAFAQAPTTAAGLAAGISVSDAQAAGLAIAAILIAIGVVLMGVRLVMSKFRPKI